jgi:CxxC motif-containing protein (DUF1111 family)
VKHTFILSILLASSALAQTSLPLRRPSSPPSPPPPPPVFGDSLRDLTATQAAAFAAGRTEFATVETVNDGLGPVFNGRSCGECHLAPALGGASRRVVTRIGTRVNGVFDPLTNFGGSLLQDHAIGPPDGSPHPFRPERVPPAATIIVHRRTTSLLGLGFVDATPDTTFVVLSQQEAARGDGTAGRVAQVQNISAGMTTAGKFGWKAQVPTLFQFAGDAYLNEMGITNPQFPNENCPSGDCNELAFNPRPGLNDTGDSVQKFADFMMMIAPPPRGPITSDANDGEQVFARIGCGSCHTATLQSGSSAIAALDHKTYHPYSDFLLHDMGSLGDNIDQGDAKGPEMRTAPLWGLRTLQTFLHDSRAQTIEDAIMAHDGQAAGSRNRFNSLGAADRAKLIAFLRSL